MLKNTLINKEATLKIAKALGDLNDNVVYVGGAVISHYIDDSGADDVRPTKDIDISLEILSISQLESIREELQSKGFTQSHEDNVMCRFRYEGVKVDVMSTKEIGWAPANRWFADGFKKAYEIVIEGMVIRLMPLPYFLASKFDAWKGRGGGDARTSHDFEDIVYLLNYTSTAKEQILNASSGVKNYITSCFAEIIEDQT
ncbi:MAG: nucleotidyl transferase AbiEii/AbiGii toxin family protein, partial [Bacteroidetes bacterium]|nr:nucleotidyl transferase AbiEii/AbiGii toxin family protein [Bacteroidota bacterium]